MEGTRRSSGCAAVLLAAVLALAGCCGLQRAEAKGNRDTPEAAFEFVTRAFAEDRTGDQIDSLHWTFQKAQGINAQKYTFARTLRPGIFRRAADLLGQATLDSVEYGRIDTRAEPSLPPRPRDAARVSLTTPRGSGVFILVDEPTWTLYTDDGPFSGHMPELGRTVRVEEDGIVVELRQPLGAPPLEGARILRVEIHHDWLIFGVESLDGFDELLGEVKATEEKAKEAPQ